MTEKNKSTADRLKIVTKQLELSRNDLSEALDVSLPSLSMYFSGRVKVRPVIALAMQATYGINATWLLTGKGNTFLKNNGNILSDESKKIGELFETIKGENKNKTREALMLFSAGSKQLQGN